MKANDDGFPDLDNDNKFTISPLQWQNVHVQSVLFISRNNITINDSSE